MITFLEVCFWVYLVSAVVLLMVVTMLDIDYRERFIFSFKVNTEETILSFVPVFNTCMVAITIYVFIRGLVSRFIRWSDTK